MIRNSKQISIFYGFVVEVGQRHISSMKQFLVSDDTMQEQYVGSQDNFEPEEVAAQTIIDGLLGFSKYQNAYYVITDSPEFATDFAQLIDEGKIDTTSTKEEIAELIDLDLQWLPVDRDRV